MIYAILLLASLANAQEASTDTASTSIEDELKASNMGKSIRELQSGRPRITGKPTFAGGICFADGTCQTTAPSGGASVQISSHVFVPGGASITGTSFLTCYATAGITVSVGSATVHAMVSGSGNTALNIEGNILVDGERINGRTGTNGMQFAYCNGVNYCSFTIIEPFNVAVAGLKKVCLQLMVTSGTFTSGDDTAVPKSQVGITQ